MGRRSLYHIALNAGQPLSDYEIRTLLHNLQSLNLITISRGRSATKITEAGRAVLAELKRESPALSPRP